MAKVSDLIALDQLAKADGDVRASYSMVEVRKARGGGHVTMGVDGKTAIELALNPDKYVAVLYIADKEQFTQAKVWKGEGDADKA